MTPEEAIAVALRRARRYPVFPIALSWDDDKHRINKRPLTIHGHTDAVTDEVTIRLLFSSLPLPLRPGEELGVGLHPGGGDGVVLDLDLSDAADGLAVLAELEAEHERLPPHPVVTTPSGGEHRYLDAPFRVGNSHRFGPGIDVRGHDGWVVAPGTHCTWGEWAIDEGVSAQRPLCPQWIAERFTNTTSSATGRWKPLERSALDPRDLAALEALERLGGHGAYSAGRYVAVTRPGKTAGASATIGHIGPGVVKMFTPNWPPLAEAGRYDADQLAKMAPAGRKTNVLRITAAADIKPQRVRWCWAERIPLGTIALLAGPEGLGKSTVGYWLAAKISRGELPGEHWGIPRAVLVCATEDSWAHTIVPRLMASGADLKRIFRVEAVVADDITQGLSLPAHLGELEALAIEKEAALLILDPLMSRLDGNLDTHKDGDVRRALEPLMSMAEGTGMAILGLIHHNKSGGSDPLQLVMASKAFTAVARSVHTVVRDPDDETGLRRVFGTVKANLGRLDLPTLSFVIEGWSYGTDDGEGSTGRIRWGPELRESVADLLARASIDPDERSALEEAAVWLDEYLTLHGARVASGDAKEAAKRAGHNERTLKRAMRRLGLSVEAEGYPRRTYWIRPVETVRPNGTRPCPTGPTGPTGPIQGRDGPKVVVGTKETLPPREGPTGGITIL